VNRGEVYLFYVIYVMYEVELIAGDLRMMLGIIYRSASEYDTTSNSSSLSISGAPHARLSYRYIHALKEKHPNHN
jgi:hypothetical protein